MISYDILTTINLTILVRCITTLNVLSAIQTQKQKKTCWQARKYNKRKKLHKATREEMFMYPWINSFSCGHSSSSLILFIVTDILSTTWIAILIFVDRVLTNFWVASTLWTSAPLSSKSFSLRQFLSWTTRIFSSACKNRSMNL